MSSKGHSGFQNRCVAFVDILGFCDIIDRMSKDDQLFRTVKHELRKLEELSSEFKSYRHEKRAKAKVLAEEGLLSSRSQSDLQITAFSDSYVISEIGPAWHVLAAVQGLGSRFLAKGILTRGGIVKGRAYHNRSVVFGPGMIGAYKLEREVAQYPRILVDDYVRDEVWSYHEGKVWKEELLRRDRDGCWYVNLMTPSRSKWPLISSVKTTSSVKSHLARVRHSLILSAARVKDKPGPLSKVRWMIHQFNKVAADHELGKID